MCKGPGSQACAQGNPETAETKLALPGAAAKGVPPVSGQYNYRLKFSKLGRMVFIGHLDLLKLFQKIFRKAGLPVRYSNGFNPHQIMSFACPLPLGFSSCAEYLDIGLTQEIEPETIKQLINMALPNGLSILDVKRAYKNASAQVAAAAYEVKFKHNVSPEIIEGILREKEIFIDKKTKSGTKREDIRGGIYDLRLIGSCTVYMLISTGSKQNLKPELLAGLICQGFDYNKFDIRYLRAEIYTLINNGLVSLNAWGEEF
ncbi:MAG: TIGR03936 family radical SAM-associated protein [Clostridiales bacterium]|nr:TIGR03936 family radical SAM-associated protein [Clostridiales bacterium]